MFIYTGIACLIFYFLLKKRVGADFKGYSAFDAAVFWGIMRLCPLFMLETRTMANYGCFAADTIVLAALTAIVCIFGNKTAGKTAAALYLFSPLPIVGIVSGSLGCTLASFAAAAVLCIVYIVGQSNGKIRAAAFVNEFILLTVSAYLVLFDIKCREITQLFGGEKIPIFIVLGAAVFAAAAVFIVRKICFLRKGKLTEKEPDAKETHKRLVSKSRERFGKKDVILMTALTAVYAVTVFFRLGSFSAPQTQMEFTSESGRKDIIIDLGDYVDVSRLKVFLGFKSSVPIALSTYNEVTEEWMLIDKDRKIDYAFEWNDVIVGWNLRYIGIVFTDEDINNAYYIREIAVLGGDGKPIIPVNAGEYPELFDEQELYPEYDTYYYEMMFDEIYHGRTAYEFLNDLPIYETTHPPLGKTIISIGIALFGMAPFGWRFMCALFGTLMVPLLYLFCRKISGRTDIAFIGAALFCTEFMHYTLSRIATIDIIAAMFIMLMFYFMYCFVEELHEGGSLSRQYVWLLLCGISTALAVSTKWTGLYAVLGIAVIFFVNLYEKCIADGGIEKNIPYLSRLFLVCVSLFMIIPAVSYCLSYIPFCQVYSDKNIVEHAVDSSINMFNYHSGITATHPYSSEWYEWLIDRRPLVDAFTMVGENNSSSTVATFGNPAILIVGLAAVLHNFYLWRQKGCKTARTLVLAYLAMLMPWLFIHRVVFIYQYFVCTIVLVLLICNSLIGMKKPRRNGLVLLGISLAMFILFFPVISGVEVSRDFVSNFLEWLPTWRF